MIHPEEISFGSWIFFSKINTGLSIGSGSGLTVNREFIDPIYDSHEIIH